MLDLIMNFFRELAKPRLSDQFFMDENGLRREISDGTMESVKWDELKKITIVTTDQGPYLEDVFFVLEGEKGGTIVSQEWATKISLLEKISKLPGFANEAVISAMGCTENNSFLCWQK